MLSPLKPLLCRHYFYWSERHQADRCRGCGKTQAADPNFASTKSTDEPVAEEPGPVVLDFRDPASEQSAAGDSFFDIPVPVSMDPAVIPVRGPRPSAKVLKAQARDRRETLLASVERLAGGHQLSRQETIDTLLGLIEDAHSADPVVFGVDAPVHFAKLHESRGTLVF